jgi:cytoskeletal protein CcmA (bactofilin family)
MAKILNDTPQAGTQPAASAPVSVVSRGLRIQGQCEVPGRLVVEGHITGDVRATHIEVVADGRVDGNVTGPDGRAPAGTVLVAGHVGGKVAAERVEVHDKGEVGGGVVTTDAIVRGRVSGGLMAGGRVTLAATGFVEGDVQARRLVVEEGGQVNGSIRMGDPAG